MRMRSCLVIAAGLALAACATESPYSAIQQAELSMKRANEAQANRYAPAELAQAQEKLGRAKVAAEDDDRWQEARRLAVQADADADLAAERAHTARTQSMLDEARAGMEALESETQRPIQRP